MGLHDREYMKAGPGGGGRWSPHRTTWTIIAINGLAWFVYASAVSSAKGPDSLAAFIFRELELWPEHVFASGRVWQLFSHFWLHAPRDASHVVFNMLALFFFGRAVETWLGPRRYLLLYLGAGLFAGLVFTAWGLALGGPGVHALGASGAVFAVLAWMACQRPTATVYLMMIIPMPMWLAVGVLMIGMEVLVVAQAAAAEGGAVAHLAGAAFGAGYWLWLKRTNTLGAPGNWLVRQRKQREQHRSSGAAHEELVRLRVDQLLEKIHREGIGALSPEEKAFLEEVSRRYG